MERTRLPIPPVAWRHVVLCLVIVLAEFIVLEAALRLHTGSEATLGALFFNDPQIGSRLQPNAHVRYTTVEFSTDLAINAQGVRDDRDIGPKAPDERRVVVLGDSYVLAVQVALADTFCKGLEARLNTADPGHRWRVINAGVQGYSAVDEWLFYTHVAEAFEPDLVIVVSFVGYAPVAASREAWLDAGGRPPDAGAHAINRVRNVAQASVVYQLARLRWDQLKAHFSGGAPERPVTSWLADPPPDVVHGLEVTRRAIGMIGARAAARGARTAIVLMPARFQINDVDYGWMSEAVRRVGGVMVRNAATERFREALAPLGVPMLDLLPVFEAQPNRAGLCFQQNVHLTVRGHQVVADALFQFLQANGLAAAR
jgi:hypothetical protein